MKEEIKLAARLRTEQGSAAVNRLRKSGSVPGVVYGAETPRNVSFNAATFATMQRRHSSENVMLTLDVEGDRIRKVLVREVQHHPLSGETLHVDFYELSMTKKVAIAIPLEFAGTPVGVSRDGGILEQLLREVEVECLPDDIIEQLDLDVSALEVGDRLTVADIPLDKSKYDLVTPDTIAVASVAAPRVEEEAVPTAEGVAGAAPEVIGAKKEGEEEKKEKGEGEKK